MKRATIIFLGLIPFSLYALWGNESVEFRSKSLRTAGMGFFLLVMDDQLYELNFYDFGANVAGLVEDDSGTTFIQTTGIEHKNVGITKSWSRDEGWNVKEKWATGRKVDLEGVYRTPVYAIKIKTTPVLNAPLFWGADMSGREILIKSKTRDFAFTYAQSPNPNFIWGGEIRFSDRYEKNEYKNVDTTTCYTKDKDIGEIKVGIILPAFIENLSLGYSFEGKKLGMGETDYTGGGVGLGTQVFYTPKTHIKLGLRANLQVIDEKRGEYFPETCGTLKDIALRGLYTLKREGNRINLGLWLGYASPIYEEIFGFSFINEERHLDYGLGISYFNRDRATIGIELHQKKTENTEESKYYYHYEEICIGGELHIDGPLFVLAGYSLTKWEGELYCFGLTFLANRIRCDAAYNFEQISPWLEEKNHTFGISLTFYP